MIIYCFRELSIFVKTTNTDTNQFFSEDIWWRKNQTTFIVPEKFDFMYANYIEDQVEKPFLKD